MEWGELLPKGLGAIAAIAGAFAAYYAWRKKRIDAKIADQSSNNVTMKAKAGGNITTVVGSFNNEGPKRGN